MGYKHVLHYGDYAVAENENLYTEMAAQGWHLVKRGSRLSKFEKGTPTHEKYRIELRAPDTAAPDDDDTARLEKSGWAYVTANGLCAIFKGSGKKKLPALYNSTEQKTAALKAMRREYRMGFFVCILAIMLMAMVSGNSLQHWLIFPEFYMLLGLIFFVNIGSLAYSAVRHMILYKSLRRDEAIDRSRTGNIMARKVGIFALCSVFVCLLLLTGLTVLRSRHYDMPAIADGPYLTLADLEWTGEPMVDVQTDAVRENTVRYENNLFAEVWDTFEGISLGAESDVWMYTTVYRLKAGFLKDGMAEYLAAGATFSQDLSQYEQVELSGFDAAYMGGHGLEYIAVKGDMAWHIIYADPGVFGPDETPQRDVLSVLAARMQ